jgi:hypothetical protein
MATKTTEFCKGIKLCVVRYEYNELSGYYDLLNSFPHLPMEIRFEDYLHRRRSSAEAQSPEQWEIAGSMNAEQNLRTLPPPKLEKN